MWRIYTCFVSKTLKNNKKPELFYLNYCLSPLKIFNHSSTSPAESFLSFVLFFTEGDETLLNKCTKASADMACA